MSDYRILEVKSLAGIQAAACSGRRLVRVLLIGHLRQAPDMHAALTEKMEAEFWRVSNMEQVAAARDMEVALAKMAGALADIGRDGVSMDELQAAAEVLEQAARELQQQQILGTEDRLNQFANPALEVAQNARAGQVDRLKVEEAANGVGDARGSRVRLDPDYSPVYVKSDMDIEELSPTEVYQPGLLQVVVHPPEEVQPYDADWAVRTEVVVTGVAPISCVRQFAERLDWSAFTRGWRVQGREKLSHIDHLLTSLDSLYISVKKMFDRRILPDNGVSTPALWELLEALEREADEFNALIFGPEMKKLLMSAGELATVVYTGNLVKDIVFAGRAVPLDPQVVRGGTNAALQAIDRVKEFHLCFLERDEEAEEEEEEDPLEKGPWEEAPW